MIKALAWPSAANKGILLVDALSSPPQSPADTFVPMLTSVVEAMSWPVAAVNADGTIRAANSAWNRFAQPAISTARCLGDLFPDAATAAAEVLRGAAAVSRRALPLAPGLSGDTTWWDLDLVPHPHAASVVLVTARDVTDHVLARREAEDARAAIEPMATRFQLTQEAAGVGTWEWTADSDRQAWSPQQFRLYGLDPATATAPSLQEWIAMVHPEDRHLIHVALETGFREKTQTGYQVEFRIRRSDTGAERWLLSLGRVTESAADGRILRILGVNLDITERRKEQEALRQSAELLRLASDAAGVYAWDWDVTSGRVTWAEGLENALGLPPSGFDGSIDAFRRMVHPDDLPGVEEALRQALAGETPVYRATFRMFRADGSTRWTETRGSVVRGDHGQPVRLVGMDHDITERKAADARLHEREAQQAAVASLGQFALNAPSAQAVMDEAVRQLIETLGVEFATVLELLPEGQELLVRAGGPWSPDRRADEIRIGDTRIAAGRYSQSGYTLLLDSGPVIVEDLQTESRFEAKGLLDHDAISGMSVIIRGTTSLERPYGVLSAHSTRRRHFTDHDIRFLEAVANLITSALQREQAEAELREREGRLHLFITRAPAAIAMFDASMCYLAASRRYIEDYGLGFDMPENIVGLNHREILPNLPQAWCDTHRSVLRGETHGPSEETFTRPDGRTETVRWEMTPWHAADGSVGGTLLFTELTTLRKATEAALIESEARFRALAETMPQLIYASSPTGFSEYKNQRWYEYSGQTPDQAAGSGWMTMLHPDDRDATKAAWDNAIATGQPYEHQHRLRGQDGEYRWFLSRATPLRAPEDNRIIRWLGTSTDISDIVHAREVAARWARDLETQVAERTRALTEAAVELQAEMRRRQDIQSALLQSQKLEALGQLTAGVAHDFNNVLAAIQGSFELIEQRTTDPKLLQLVALGQNASGRAASLTRQLLDFGRSESLVAAVLDVETAINRADAMIGHAIGAQVSRTKQIQHGVWSVLTDGQQLEIALLNLAINARDAMPEGGKISLVARNLAPEERPEALPLNDYVSISVRDNGQGMPPDVLARATEPFFTTKSEGKGTGLGLPMVHAFAMRSGGCLRIDSQVGAGTTVEIILPRASVTEMETQPTAAVTIDGARAQRPATIMVVEDDSQVREITVGYLRNCGYSVIEATNAESATVLSHSSENLDLLLTDVAMPGAEGPELARRLRIDHPDLPVLFITGHRGRDDLDGEAVLLKPFTGADLVRAINQHLGRTRLAGSQPPGLQKDARDDSGLLQRLKNPALITAYLLWRAAGNGGKPPRSSDLDWGGLPEADNAFTVAVEWSDDVIGFRYLRVGRLLSARLGRAPEDIHARPPSDADRYDELVGSLASAYRRCALTLAPSYEYARYNLGDGPPVLFERLILPVSDDGKTVTHLIGLVLLTNDI